MGVELELILILPESDRISEKKHRISNRKSSILDKLFPENSDNETVNKPF